LNLWTEKKIGRVISLRGAAIHIAQAFKLLSLKVAEVCADNIAHKTHRRKLSTQEVLFTWGPNYFIYLRVPAKNISRIVGIQGSNVDKIRKSLGVRINVEWGSSTAQFHCVEIMGCHDSVTNAAMLMVLSLQDSGHDHPEHGPYGTAKREEESLESSEKDAPVELKPTVDRPNLPPSDYRRDKPAQAYGYLT